MQKDSDVLFLWKNVRSNKKELNTTTNVSGEMYRVGQQRNG